MPKTSIFWFRRDLRISDNHGLYRALRESSNVKPIFIFDKNILNKLDKTDHRVEFILNVLNQINLDLKNLGKGIEIYYGTPEEIFSKLLNRYNIDTVYSNEDYEPYAIKRDNHISDLCEKHSVKFKQYTDHVLLHPSTIKKQDGKPYTIFTPFSKKWFEKYNSLAPVNYPSENLLNNFVDFNLTVTKIQDLGFKPSQIELPNFIVDNTVINNYHLKRDFPSIKGTTKWSVHLRFGTISIRKTYELAKNQTLKTELVWREFYQMIMLEFPYSLKDSFKPKYDKIEWLNNEKNFELWCKGMTGYPIVDAGMRELNATGHMHNRVRMVVASFLTKHLLIDWRWGEAYFAKMLFDFELASNVGGWQWAAGCGCDAAPYFRVFNPYTQQEKFDKNLAYIKKWIPEFDDPFTYPKPIVDHKFARTRAIEHYKSYLNPTV